MNDNQTILAHRVIGNGRPVVFLHGFLESSSMWKYLQIPEGIQAVLVDLPRHGASKHHSGKSVSQIAEKMLEVLSHLKVQSFSIVGHSLGGYVALEMKKQSSKCEKVVLLNSNFWEDSPIKKQDRERVVEVVQRLKNQFIEHSILNLFSQPEMHPEEIQDLIDEAKEISADSIAEISLAMKNRVDNSELLSENPNDFWVIQGEKDAIVPVGKMRQEKTKIAFNYVEISSVGHMSHIENPSAVEAILSEVFSS